MTTTLLHQLQSRRFLVVTGKGGVGKSAIAAALARTLAAAGRRVLLVEIDPRESLHQLFGVAPSGGDVVPFGHGLWLQNLKPRQALDELMREQLGSGLLFRRLTSSAGYHHLAEGAPGLKELAILHYAAIRVEHRGEDGFGPFHTVILDAPATGHGVTLLAAPLVVAEVIREGPVGRKAAELAEFVRDRQRLGLVVVTLAEEMPVQESLELREQLQEKLGREPEMLVVNGLYPPLPAEPETAPAAAQEALAAWHQRRAVNERELGRLHEHWPGSIAELPLLPLDRGPELVNELRQRLESCLEEAP